MTHLLSSKKVYLVGIKGSGVSALACILKKLKNKGKNKIL